MKHERGEKEKDIKKEEKKEGKREKCWVFNGGNYLEKRRAFSTNRSPLLLRNGCY